MRQTWPIALLLSATLMLTGCWDRRPAAVPDGIVSLTPAGTDLLLAMGLGDHIVGVSSYEANASLRHKLPKVGDYLRVDWERLAELRPAYLVVQGKRDRLPSGMKEKANDLHIATVILQIDRLGDIDNAIEQIGDALKDPAAASKVLDDLARRRAALQKNAGVSAMPAMIVFSDSGKQVVGRETFIDDALTLAGGKNVIDAAGYLSIDREKLAALQPRVVFLILPNADPAAVERGKASLNDAGVSATARIVPITDVDALMPGTCAYRLAETMATHLKAAS